MTGGPSNPSQQPAPGREEGRARPGGRGPNGGSALNGGTKGRASGEVLNHLTSHIVVVLDWG
jgi:hypothetical protein